MTTQEKTKREMLEEFRAKREAKKQAKLKAARTKRITAAIALIIITAGTFGTVLTASAKEVKITEINEFTGKNETKTVITWSDNVGEVLDRHGVDVSDTDRLNVSSEKEINDKEDIVITRGKRVTIKVNGCEDVVTVTKSDVKDALVEAGYVPGEFDQISMNADSLADGDTIELVSVSSVSEITTEAISHGVDYVDDPNLPRGQEKVINEGQDGVKEITHKVTYQNGAETSRETISETITVEPENKVIARGTANPTPQPAKPSKKESKSKSSSPSKKSSVSDDGGSINGYKYKKKITMTATAYSPSASENGGYTVSAMGNPLKHGIVAVDPNIVPLGSKVYVTSADGSWSYGVASAEDTGGAIKGNRIDLCYTSNAMAFGRKSCVVYVLE